MDRRFIGGFDENNTGMIRQLNPGLSLYRLKFDKKHEKILYSEKYFLMIGSEILRF